MAKKDTSENTEAKKSKLRKKLLLPIIGVVALLALAGGVAALAQAYVNQKERADRLSNPTEAAKEETRLLLEKVGALTDLPNEEPTVATVRDVTKLQDQTFFKNAQNEDKVLIYPQAKKAILYRPSTDKIIEIAPVNLGEGQQQGAETESKPAEPKESEE